MLLCTLRAVAAIYGLHGYTVACSEPVPAEDCLGMADQGELRDRPMWCAPVRPERGPAGVYVENERE